MKDFSNRFTFLAVVLCVSLFSSCTFSTEPQGGSIVSSSSSVDVSSSGVHIESNCSLNGGTVSIGNQVWMAENLNCDVSGSKCYNNDPAYCAIYGRLYNLTTAKIVCPSGWHLPSKAEWDALTTYIESDKGCSRCDAKHLKSTSGWSSVGLDSYKFAALPGGSGYFAEDFISINAGITGDWWSATEMGPNGNELWDIHFYDDARWYFSKDGFYSVRCLKD